MKLLAHKVLGKFWWVDLSGHLFGHKYFEVNLGFQSQWAWFSFELKWTRKQDHAGPSFYAEILGLNLQVSAYDHRHWNHDKDRWYLDGEEGEHEVDWRDHEDQEA